MITFEKVLEGFTIVEDDMSDVFEEPIGNILERQITELIIKQELGVLI